MCRSLKKPSSLPSEWATTLNPSPLEGEGGAAKLQRVRGAWAGLGQSGGLAERSTGNVSIPQEAFIRADLRKLLRKSA